MWKTETEKRMSYNILCDQEKPKVFSIRRIVGYCFLQLKLHKSFVNERKTISEYTNRRISKTGYDFYGKL